MKPNCNKHKRNIDGYDDIVKLANDVGDLHYESLKDFLYILTFKLKTDASNDKAAGRKELAKNLDKAGDYVFSAYRAMDRVWDICKPYMKNDEK